MSNPNGRKGAGFETDLLRHFRSRGFDAERLPKTGRDDQGDLVLKLDGMPLIEEYWPAPRFFVLEAKNEKRLNLASYVAEAEVEAGNYSKARGIEPAHYAAVVKRRQHSIGKAYVVVPLDQWLSQVGGL